MQGIRDTTRHGFTLVELAIVLVIIGLLVGGVLTGQQLINTASLRTVASDINAYHNALGVFNGTYTGLPGDIPNATTIWGQAHSDATTCQTTVGTGTQTCNGDNNGRIGGAPSVYEYWRAWQQMANAGLIRGSYVGVIGTSAGYATSQVAGVNTPALRNEGMVVLLYTGGITGNADWFDVPAGNYFQIGYSHAGAFRPVFSSPDARDLDQKLDDGMPSTGRLRGSKNGSPTYPGCSDTAVPPAYSVGDDGLRCLLLWLPML